jgi:hypothetical protein
MRKQKLNKPVLGIDQLSDETDLVHNSRNGITAIREGENIDIDRDGNVSRRKGYTLKLAGPDYHSLYESQRGYLFACKDRELGIYDPDSNTFNVMTNMPKAYLTSFTELNGNLYHLNPGSMGLLRLDESAFRPLGVALPDTLPEFSSTSPGGLRAGEYAIGLAVVNDLGEESVLSRLVRVRLNTKGAILCSLLTVVPGFKYRVYMTPADGEELYQAAEFDANTTSFLVTKHQEGRRPATKNMSRLPFGHIIRAHGSRLFVASDGFVFFSSAFMPHLTNEAHDFIPTTGFTLMMESVDGGMYIGDRTGVTFYRGDDPQAFDPKAVSTEPPIFGTAITVPGSFLPEKHSSKDSAAIWLSESGYHIGLSSGEVVKLHVDQVSLPKYPQGCTALSIQDGRKQLITPVNSNVLATAGVALDSTF